MSCIKRGAGLLLLALGIWIIGAPGSSTAADDDGPVITEAQFKELVKRALENVDEGMKDWKDTKKKEKERKEHYRKARGAAIMIAAYAQGSQTAANAMEHATIRDAALKLATLIEKDQLPAAKKLVEELKSGVKPNPNVKTDKIKLMPKYVKIEEVMKQFSSKPGGSQLEAKLIQNYLTNKKLEKAKEFPTGKLDDEYALMLIQVAAISDLIKDHDVPKKSGKGAKEWKEFNKDMHKTTVELLKMTAGAKDGKAAWKTLNKLDGSCSGCHKIWRDDD